MSPRFPEKRRDSFESRLMYLKKRRKNSAQMASGTEIFFFFFLGGGVTFLGSLATKHRIVTEPSHFVF